MLGQCLRKVKSNYRPVGLVLVLIGLVFFVVCLLF